MTATLESLSLSLVEAEFFRAGDELEALQAIDTIDDPGEADERAGFWQRLRRSTER